MGSSFGCELRLTSINQDVCRGRCCSCLRQWLRHVQGRLRRRRRPQGRLPLHRWPSPSPGCHGRYGTCLLTKEAILILSIKDRKIRIEFFGDVPKGEGSNVKL